MFQKNQLVNNIPSQNKRILKETTSQGHINIEIMLPEFNIDQSELIYIPLPKKINRRIHKSRLFLFEVTNRKQKAK